MSEAKPYSKEQQLSRGPRRYRRKVAGRKQWEAIIAEKRGPCRVCCDPANNGSQFGRIQFHHIVSRAQGGDDVAENCAPLCPDCHDLVTRRDPQACATFCASLTDSEYAYMIGKLGEGATERIYGIKYESR